MKTQSIQNLVSRISSGPAAQFGGGLLPVVATVGVVMIMAQGTVYYKAKTGSQFLNAEKNKVLAQQVAEAGIENGISDLGSRRVVISDGMREQVTAQGVTVGNGTFTTRLTTVARGPQGDTIDFYSTGQVSGNSKSVSARLKLNDFVDSTPTILSVAVPDTVRTLVPVTVYDTTITTTVQNPLTLPALNTTPAYAACMSKPGHKCDICHLTSSDVNSAFVIPVAKPSINTHISHHGDYVTTDGTCDIYKPKNIVHVTSRLSTDTLLTITSHITYDTTMTIDTLTRIKVLAWK